MNKVVKSISGNIPKTGKTKAKKIMDRYNSQIEKYSAMTLEELKAIRANTKLSLTDEHALGNAIHNLENPVNEDHNKMVDDAVNYDLQKNIRIDNVAAVRWPTDDFTFATIGSKEIVEKVVNERFMPAILTDWWFDYFKFEKVNDRWEKVASNGMKFYGEKIRGVLHCLTESDPQIDCAYVHQLQNNWIDVCGTPLIDMHKTLSKSLSI